MLQDVKKRTAGFFTKLLLAVIIASFALWGVGDMFRGGISGSYAMKSGDYQVSLQEYRDELNMRYASLRQVMGAQFTPEIAARLGIHQQVMSDLSTGLLVQRHADEIGLRIPEQSIIDELKQTPAFQAGGEFDKDVFQQALRRANLTEERFVAALKKENLAQLLFSAFENVSLPQTSKMAEMLYRVRNESRDVTLYLFSPQLDELAEPSDTELAEYYSRHGEQFREPEYRKISYVSLNPETIASDVKADEETLETLYEEERQNYIRPEQREVSQLLYSSKEEALKAQEMLEEGASFAEVVNTISPDNEALSLGLVTRAELPQEAQDLVFLLEKAAISEPIETAFGWHIFRVEAIVPESITPFEEVKSQLAKRWKVQKQEDYIYDVTIELEDSLAAGISLADAAKEFGIQTQQTDWLNLKGMDEKGEPVSLPNLSESAINAAFKLTDTTESSLVEGEEGHYFLIALDDVKESYIPELDSIRSQVQTAWLQSEQRNRRYEAALEMAKDWQSEPGKISADRKIIVKGIKRSGELPSVVTSQMAELPPGLREELFRLQNGEISTAYNYNSKAGQFVVAKLNHVYKVQTEDASESERYDVDIEKIQTELKRNYANELTAYYLASLERKYPIEVNHIAIEQISK